MPSYEISFPVNSYNMEDSEATTTRTGIDGAENVFLLYGGAGGWLGESLEGLWQKGGDFVNVTSWTALISGGSLLLTSAGAGTAWIYAQPKSLLDEDFVHVVHLGVPATVSSGKVFSAYRYFMGTFGSGDPESQNNYLRYGLRNNNGTYQYSLYKRVAGGASTAVKDWTALSNAKAALKTVWDTTVVLSVEDGATSCAGSFTPAGTYTLSLDITEAYQAFRVLSDDGTGRTAYSACDTVSVPDFDCRYDLLDADTNKGIVKVFDTMGSAVEADWAQVFDPDHVFVGDCVVQNGLIRLWVGEGAQYGLKLYYWNGSAWAQPKNRFRPYLTTSGTYVDYPFLKSVQTLTLENVSLRVRSENSGVEDGNFYVDYTLNLERGRLNFSVSGLLTYPSEPLYLDYYNSSYQRFGYAGNAETAGVGDDDLLINGSNTTLSDNFMVTFDDSGLPVLCTLSISRKPDSGAARFLTYHGGKSVFESITYATLPLTTIYVGFTPFAKIAYTFKEAELATLSGGATAENDATASGGQVAYLDAQNENVSYLFTAGTDLPKGRYAAVFRVKDANQVANDLNIFVYNNTDSQFRNDGNGDSLETCSASWTFKILFFDITDADASGTKTFRIYAYKYSATANAISVDYFLIVPLGNGCDFPQDIAHNALRSLTKTKNIYKR
jgi:hypothetical protein